jgi:predicted alpha/beta superfamily hydrolase
MNRLKPMNLPLTLLLLLIFSSSMFGQKLEPKNRITEPDHTISSQIMGRDYQLYISFPYSYSTKDSITYPVLYVMDGRRDFHTFNQINRYITRNGLTEDVIIVGVNSGLDLGRRAIRSYDYSPTELDSATISRIEINRDLPKGTLKTGGAPKSLEVLKTEIIPFVDKSYKTNSDRGITGHSMGGLFTAYCLMNSDGYFTRFGINSPYLTYKNEELLEQAVLQFTENKTWDIPPTRVFMSAGEKEPLHYVPNMTKFIGYLDKAEYENIDLSWHIFDNETHSSTIPLSLHQTIIELYRK